MNLKLVTLSFFKSESITYFLEEPYLYFPCVKCGKNTKMFLKTSDWECTSCMIDGTISHLIEYLKYNQKAASSELFYNPKKENLEIENRFKSLSKKHGKDIDELYIKVQNYIEYLRKACPK